MKTSAPLLAAVLLASSPFVVAHGAFADSPADSPVMSKKGGTESPKPITGKAPVDPPKGAESAKVSETPTKVFDTSEFGEPDKATAGLIKGIEAKCTSSPMSREGMSEAEEKRCNAAVARLVQHGSAAVPTILAKLNDTSDKAFDHYYARTRLFYALAKMDDPKIEDVLIRGYARIATGQIEASQNDLYSIDGALVAMNGANPVAAERIGRAELEDNWKASEDAVITWRVWQKKHAGKSKAQNRSEALKQARADKNSRDVKKQYLALSTLAELEPNEALKELQKLVNREDIKDEDKQPFYALDERAYENGGRTPPDLDDRK